MVQIMCWKIEIDLGADKLSRFVILRGGTLRDINGNLPMFPYYAAVAVAVAAAW